MFVERCSRKLFLVQNKKFKDRAFAITNVNIYSTKDNVKSNKKVLVKNNKIELK